MLISRDPFARQELHRRSVSCGAQPLDKAWKGITCEWCGSIRATKRGTRYLYKYSTETDGGRKFDHRGLFCCKQCHDAYHQV